MEPDSTESWTDGRWRSQSEAEAAPATGTPAVRLELASAADSRLQQRLWALAVCGLGPNLGDNGVRYRSEEQLLQSIIQKHENTKKKHINTSCKSNKLWITTPFTGQNYLCGKRIK